MFAKIFRLFVVFLCVCATVPQSFSSELEEAVREGDVYRARHLVKQGARVKPDSGMIDVALTRHNPELVQVLLDAGVNPSGHLNGLLLTLSLNIKLTSFSSVMERAPYAAIDGDLKCYKTLLDGGADPNELDRNGFPAIMMAFSTAAARIDEVDKYRDIVRLLLDAGANVNVTCSIEEVVEGDGAVAIIERHCSQQINVLCLAAFYMDEEIVAQVLERAKVTSEDLDVAIGVAEDRILENHQSEVVELLKNHRKKVLKAEQEAAESASYSEELLKKKAEETEYVIEQATSTRYVFWGLAGCMGVLLLVVILFTKKKKPVVVLEQPRKKRVAAAPRAARPAVAEHKRPKLTVATPKHSVSPPPSPVYSATPPPYSATPPPYSATPPPFVPAADAKIYMIAMPDGSQAGPYSLDELHYYLLTGVFTPYTPVWCSGMPNWVPLSSILS